MGNVKKTGLVRSFLVVFLLLMPVSVRAYDFSLTVGGGQTLYFNVLGSSVEVVYPNNTVYPVNGWDNFTRPVGDLQIPATVSYNGAVYDVVSVGALAFNGCTGLTSVVIGEGVVSLGSSAFNGCSSLSTVVIPSSVDTIGVRTFGECGALSHVWCNRESLPSASANVFYNTSLANSTLHVPQAALQAYSAAAPWSSFGTILGDGPRVDLSVVANDGRRGSVTGGGSFAAGSIVEIGAQPAEGYSFICWNDGNTQNPRSLTLTGSVRLVAMFFPLQHDTVAPVLHSLRVLSSQESLGVGVGTTEVPEGTVVEICALPLQGGRFAGWSDGSTANPRRVTVTGDLAFTAFFEQVSIASTAVANVKVHADGGEVVVEDANGLCVEIYDCSGRLVLSSANVVGTYRVALPTAGVYVVRVGDRGTVKVAVE